MYGSVWHLFRPNHSIVLSRAACGFRLSEKPRRIDGGSWKSTGPA